MDKILYDGMRDILKKELVPALGCTEPIAIAYAAAKARSVLDAEPESIKMICSGNIVKNVKAVVVPNSGGMRGIEAAAALGAIGGDSEKALEVLQTVTPSDIERAKALLEKGFCVCELADTDESLYVRAEVKRGEQSASVEIQHEHTNITRIEKNGRVVFENAGKPEIKTDEQSDAPEMSLRSIIDFADEVDVESVRDILDRQIELNTAISNEGLKHRYGAQIGKSLLAFSGENDVMTRAKARAAAGSDARMSGCAMPVVINSGSGNQGITVSLPVIEYADTKKSSREQLYRALVVANLVSVHIKRHIGSLSAFCGATSAGCGAACGIAYLDGCDYDQIAMTVTNTLCNIGGMVCDGAKPSCAAKIASAVEAGIMGYRMAMTGHTFKPGEGLAGKNVEQTIENFGRVGRDGMRATDLEILHVMLTE